MSAPKLVAEVGCNHQGDLEIAKRMIETLATFCQVDVVKFQKRNPRELLPGDQYNGPHPTPEHAFGVTYGGHREFLEFSAAQHSELKDVCERANVTYSASVWDMTSAREIVALRPSQVKIGSGSNLHWQLLAFVCDEFGGTIHLSLGMTTREEETRIVEFIGRRNRLKDLVLYACTSGYPVDFDDLALLEIKRLRETYGRDISAVGFSGHHLGIAADIAAIALGAEWIERHFTLDRTWKGTDHAASLEPDGMRRLARDIKNVSRALRYKRTDILDIERTQRAKLKWQDRTNG